MANGSSAPQKRDADWVAAQIKIHKKIRRAILFALIAVAAIITGGWYFAGRIGDRAFDGRRYTVADVIDGDTIVLADNAATRVALLGVDAPDWPDAHYSKESAGYLSGRLKGNVVLIKLDGTQSRNDAARLLAYVYLTDSDLINADIIRDGRGFSDRRTTHTFRQQFDQIENEARTAARGMWDEMTDDQQPAWRQEWLRSRRK
jgi:endonuclease YncB( thermonuclease family)